MSIVYTDPGLMDRQIDIWDEPPTPNPADGSPAVPVQFATNVYAYIVGIWATNLIRKQSEHLTSEISHQIIIRYMPGLRSRMFILYNDPDVTDDDTGAPVPRRFDIDRIIDPDEHKVELRILAIERNEGR